MSPSEPSGSPSAELDEDDQNELKEIIVEFLSRYEGLYEKRIQKLVFYSELYSAEKTGGRLTDATFMPYYHGPYSRTVTSVLDELEDAGRISVRDNGQYATGHSKGNLSHKKRYLIDKIHAETKRMSTNELVNTAKETWLWKNFEQGEDMDFVEYLDNVIMSPEMRDRLPNLSERNPVDDPDLERLLS